jgi:hypothetical protein
VKEGSRFNDFDETMSSSSHHFTTTPKSRRSTTTSITTSPLAKRRHLSTDIKKYSVVSPLVSESIQKSLGTSTTPAATSITKNDSKDVLNYGPLTQRLISSLIEQNLMTPFDTEITDYLENHKPPPQPLYMSPRSMAKRLNLNTNVHSSLERKIKKTLIEQGILNLDENNRIDDLNTTSEDERGLSNGNSGINGRLIIKKEATIPSTGFGKDDEIANEIRNLQNEMMVISKQCKETLTQLLTTSKQSIIKQDIKKKLALIDAEVNFEL